ncbi:ABC-type multidrug transport system fused ATPase/permease subunit [Kribbella orskensis]|uniref:ABC-type multidrug transport system fused ATPase/permease subunit n=1 Tax=Kribbella orskensis TaxID=2512216 RepID=A0ABY2BS51_9ACTN|nr:MULTISPECIES: ABC transporter ATP-binding protein [Kribbella]TCN43210.1 ABC-type multidrug transport system fused ATPase/permease subunit [Kribbella sp. VKM Ac-2500]TCO29434.1 ABC-type multidrug transport system fused ATPase/permease subunit [Kribbella orskensis]
MPQPKVPSKGSVTRRGFAVLRVAIWEEPWVFALSVLASMLYGAMTVADGWALGWATDHVIRPALERGDTTFGAIASMVSLFLGIAVLRAIGVVGRRIGAGVMQFRLQATYRERVTRQYLKLPLEWHHKHPTGELLSNANADVESTWYPIAPLPMAVGVIAMLAFATVAMFAADPWLAAVGCLVFPLVFVANVIFQRTLQPLATRAQELRADVSEVAHESFDGALVVKTLGREAAETERFRAPTYELRDANIAVNKARGAFDPVIEGLPRIGVLAVLLVGVGRVSSGAADAGDVVQVAFLFTLIGFPIRALGWVLGELPRSVVGWDRVQRVITAEGGMEYGAEKLTHSSAARLEVSDVRFGYLPDRDVLAGVDFTVEPGRTVAVVGPTGAGKSTMTTLLTRLVDPEEGSVKVDDHDLRSLARDELAGSVALVAQTAFLFDDTIRGNITLGGDYTDADVWDSLRIAQGDGFVKSLSHGLDTKVGERGTTLSGGQRQRIALARALVRRPRLLILDDATSAVDPQVEARILAGLRTAVQGAEAATTVLVIAYRKATIALADEVLFLDEGRIADQGSHLELQARSAAYRDLVDAYEKDAARREEEAALEADMDRDLDTYDAEGASA